MGLTCFQQILLDQVLADYGEGASAQEPSPDLRQAAAIFRRAQKRWHPVSIGVRVAGWVSVLLIPALALGFWILRDHREPPPVTEPTSQTTEPTELTGPETVDLQLLTEARSYNADGTLYSVTVYTYDDRGLPLTLHTDYTDDKLPDQDIRYTYDDHGYLQDSGHSGYTYDGEGRLTGGIVYGIRYQITYDGEGRPERVQAVTGADRLEDMLTFDYEDGQLRYVFDRHNGDPPTVYSFVNDEQGLSTDLPRWSRILPEGYGDLVLTREWGDIGTYELTYTDGVLAQIRHLAASPELEISFRLDEAGNTTWISRPSGESTEYDFRTLTLEADQICRRPRRDFFNEEAPIKCYPDDILRILFP